MPSLRDLIRGAFMSPASGDQMPPTMTDPFMPEPEPIESTTRLPVGGKFGGARRATSASAPAASKPRAALPPIETIFARPETPSDMLPGSFEYESGTDFAPSREAFLSRGSSPEIGMMADAMGARSAIEENAASGRRPDLFAQMLNLRGMRTGQARDDLALQRERLALQRSDPAYQREQRRLDTISNAETYMDPRMGEQRWMDINTDVARRKAIDEVAIVLGMDPRVLQQKAQEHQRRLEIARASSPYGGAMAGAISPGGAQPTQQQPQRGGITADVIRQRGLALGKSEQEIIETIEEARARGVLVQ